MFKITGTTDGKYVGKILDVSEFKPLETYEISEDFSITITRPIISKESFTIIGSFNYVIILEDLNNDGVQKASRLISHSEDI